MPGPAPGARCTACNHPGLALINNLLNQGESDYKVAGQMGLPRNVVRRHRVNGHPGVGAGARTRGSDLAAARRDPAEASEPPPEFPASGTPREQMAWLVGTLRAQAEDGDVRSDVARELRLALEAQEKMGTGEAPSVVRVRDVEGLPAMLRDMHEALKPWPDARAAMAEVWARHRAAEGDGDAAAEG